MIICRMVNYRRVRIPGATYFFTVTLRDRPLTRTARPTPIQHQALDLLGVAVACTQ
jgi:hypothetical protein